MSAELRWLNVPEQVRLLVEPAIRRALIDAVPDWCATLTIGWEKEPDDEYPGNCMPRHQYRTATIFFSDAILTEPEADIEEHVLHECGHILAASQAQLTDVVADAIGGKAGAAIKALLNHAEDAVATDYARSILRARSNGNPSSA